MDIVLTTIPDGSEICRAPSWCHLALDLGPGHTREKVKRKGSIFLYFLGAGLYYRRVSCLTETSVHSIKVPASTFDAFYIASMVRK